MMKVPPFRSPRGFRRRELRPGAAAAIGAALAAALLHGLAPFWLLPAAGAFAALRFARRSGVAFAVGLLLVGLGAAGSALLHRTDGLARRCPGELCRVDLRCRLIDPRLAGDGEVPPPESVLAETTACSAPDENDWQPVSGRCMLRFPGGRRVPPRGSIVEAKGVLRHLVPRAAVLRRDDGRVRRIPFGESYRRHLAARGSEFTFAIRDFEVRGESRPGPAELLSRLRGRLIRSMLRGVDSDRDRAMIAAFFFGATGGLTAKLRQNFIASGTVHLFAVSGLHIGMLAALLGILFRPLPFRIRHWCLPGAIWCYVLLTGANAPAMRAGFMITLWCVCRASLRYVPAVDLLGIAAMLMLAWQPALIADVGFRYSFVITAALLLLAERRQEFLLLAGAETRLIPSPADRRRLNSRRRWGRGAAEALTGCTAAFLAGAGISLAGAGELLPGSIAANLAMLPLLPFFFAAALLQLLTGGSCAALPAGCFDLLANAAGIFGRLFSAIPAAEPGRAAVLLYYAGLFLWFGHPSPRLRRCGAAAALALLVCWTAAPHFAAPKVLILSRSGAHPVTVAAVDPANARAFVVNPPAGDGAFFLAEKLHADGVRQVETLYFDRPRLDRAAGAAAIGRTLPVIRRRLPGAIDRGAGRFLQELEERAGREDAVSTGPGGEPVEIVESLPKKLRLRIADPLSGLHAEIETSDTDAGRFVSLRGGGGESSVTLPWSRELQVWEITPPRRPR